jgi:hypothetical protein
VTSKIHAIVVQMDFRAARAHSRSKNAKSGVRNTGNTCDRDDSEKGPVRELCQAAYDFIHY